MKMHAIAFVLLFAGCATSGSDLPKIPAVGLSLDEARQITASFETRQGEIAAKDPLRTPKSLDDVLEILKTDQIDLFAAGVAFAEKQEGIKAVTLRAQIELAWAEAQMILSETFHGAGRNLRGALNELEVKGASGDLSDMERERLDQLRKTVGQTSATAEALSRLASEHVIAGARLAKEVIEKNPNDYLGYRVAADFYRLRQDWEGFDKMVKKIEETNPKSNGLVFLSAVSAAQREGNAGKAAELFKKALENDPKFVRAQVQVFLLQQSIGDTYAEFTKLKTLNPNHQIVIWAGEYIQSAFDEQKARAKRMQAHMKTPGK